MRGQARPRAPGRRRPRRASPGPRAPPGTAASRWSARGSTSPGRRRACWPRSRRPTPCTAERRVVVRGRRACPRSSRPGRRRRPRAPSPASCARRARRSPGAARGRPGTSTAPMTRSASSTSRSIAYALDASVRTRPPNAVSVSRSRGMRQVEHRDVGAHADGDLRRVPADHAAAEHDDLRGVDARAPRRAARPAPPSFFIRWYAPHLGGQAARRPRSSARAAAASRRAAGRSRRRSTWCPRRAARRWPGGRPRGAGT